jgi:hypothetical protein
MRLRKIKKKSLRIMDQFKQYGIITLLGIALFGGLYSSIQLMEWQFFPYVQIAILSLLTLLIGLIHYVHKDKSSTTFLVATWAFVGFEWLVCLILFNQPTLLIDYVQLIFLPLLYFINIALFQLILTRSEQIQKRARILFYLLISSTLTFFISPNAWSAGGMELLFLLFIGQILFSKAISSEQ